MIRRWSHINNTVLNEKKNVIIYFKLLFLIFKKTIIFKKFSIKNTKFNKKSVIRIKHRKNWIIYSQILKNWITNFKILKIITKYQYFNKILLFKFLIFDFNKFKFNDFKLINENKYFLTNFFIKIYKNIFFYNF